MSKAFDQLAKLLAGGGSRRDILKALGGLLAGGFLMGLTGKAAAQTSAGDGDNDGDDVIPRCRAYCRSCRGLRGGVHARCLERCRTELRRHPTRKLCGTCTASTPFTLCAGGATCVTSTTRNYCTNLQTDVNNCGTVGHVCTAGNSTGTGNKASDTFRCCSGKCTDVSTDSNNCGTCGNVCPTDAPTCINGVCGILYCQ